MCVHSYTLPQPNITESHQDSYQNHMFWMELSKDLQINIETNQNIMFPITLLEN